MCMAPIKKKSSHPSAASALRDFVTQLQRQRGTKKLEEFLHAVLTPKEIAEISRRLQIIKMLQAGVPQREIAKTLGVGIATVTKGSRELQRGKFGK